MGKKWSIEEVKLMLLDLCRELNKIPTWQEIQQRKGFPGEKPIRRLFKEYNGGYVEFCKNNGFEQKYKKGNISKFEYTTFDELCLIWEDFKNKYGRYPSAEEYKYGNAYGLPAMRNIHLICKNRFYEFVHKYGIYRGVKYKSYNEYVEIFKDVCNNLGRPLKTIELDRENEYSNILPSHMWFIKNCPDKNVKTYDDFLKFIGIEKPKRSNYKCVISKEEAIERVINKQKSLNRPIQGRDFKNIEQDGVGIKIIKRYWGTFNNMLKELNLPINQVDMLTRQKSIKELKNDIINLCDFIKKTENREIIYYDDISENPNCSHAETYNKFFKKELNMTVGDFIRSIGFQTGGFLGDVCLFDNGEKTKSKYEFLVSNYLRENNVFYERDVLYRKFTIYNGKMNCDYKIIYNGIPYYVEIAGMMNKKQRNNPSSKITKNYHKKLLWKEWLLKQVDANYAILYPEDFQKPLNEVFSFLGTKDTYWEVKTS